MRSVLEINSLNLTKEILADPDKKFVCRKGRMQAP